MTPASTRRSVLLASLAAAVPTGLAIARPMPPVARTSAGRVRGISQSGIQVFKGIPYGADTRPRRFMPPMKPRPWHGWMNSWKIWSGW